MARKPNAKTKPRQTKQTVRKKAAQAAPAAPDWQETFLALLAESCNVTLAARGAGVCRATVYTHRDANPDFAARWADAEQQAIDGLEEEAWRRARMQSDTLMIFLLKGRRREIYGESIEHRVRKLSDEDLIAEVSGLVGGDGSAGSDAAGHGG